jgi:hypothetical protein
MERVVNIYADGRLAYTGPLDRAAARFGTKESTLERKIDNGWSLSNPHETPEVFATPDGIYRRFRPKTYVAKWRDA